MSPNSVGDLYNGAYPRNIFLKVLASVIPESINNVTPLSTVVFTIEGYSDVLFNSFSTDVFPRWMSIRGFLLGLLRATITQQKYIYGE